MSATADESVWPFLQFLSRNCPLLNDKQRKSGGGGGEQLTRKEKERRFILEEIAKRGKSKPRFL